MPAKWLTPNIRAVFFDAVGTVLDPQPGAIAIYHETALKHGVSLDISTLKQRFIEGYLLEEEIDRKNQWRTSEQREIDRWRTIVTAALPTLPASCFDELFLHFSLPSAWVVPAGLPELLAELERRGLILGLGSNYDSRLNTVLAGHDSLAILKQNILISSEIGVRKPGSAFFEQLCQQANCQPDAVLFIGDDRDNDYEGSTNAGLQPVMYDPATRYPEIPRRITQWSEILG